MSLSSPAATVGDVKLHLGVSDDSRDDMAIGLAVDAVNAYLPSIPVGAAHLASVGCGGDEIGDWPADIRLGATMLAARLYKRRNSPGGVAAMGEAGVAYIARTDPDVAMLLSLGVYAKPAVG